MTRGRLITAIASGLAVGGLALGLTLSASATPAHPVASTAAPYVTSAPPVVFDCPAQPALVEPKTYILTCADANSYVGKLSWTSWTSGLASAKGVLAENDCTAVLRGRALPQLSRGGGLLGRRHGEEPPG